MTRVRCFPSRLRGQRSKIAPATRLRYQSLLLSSHSVTKAVSTMPDRPLRGLPKLHETYTPPSLYRQSLSRSVRAPLAARLTPKSRASRSTTLAATRQVCVIRDWKQVNKTQVRQLSFFFIFFFFRTFIRNSS